jgi:hypothetical protein
VKGGEESLREEGIAAKATGLVENEREGDSVGKGVQRRCDGRDRQGLPWLTGSRFWLLD